MGLTTAPATVCSAPGSTAKVIFWSLAMVVPPAVTAMCRFTVRPKKSDGTSTVTTSCDRYTPAAVRKAVVSAAVSVAAG